MVLILISWLYIVFTLHLWGTAGNHGLRLKITLPIVQTTVGLALLTFFAGVWSLFGRLNWEFHSALLLLNLGLAFVFKRQWIAGLHETKQRILHLSPFLKTYLLGMTLLIVAQCAAAPYVIDNESYYLQNIKWLNEYGMVKGLINLHFFLGQLSGWHIAQSALNFSFLFDRFNDLSGLFLLYGIGFSIQQLHQYFENGKRHALVVGLFPMASVLLFQFISAPSPDVVVYVLTFVIFYLFIENYSNPTKEIFVQLTLLVLFTLFIKNTAMTLALLPIFWFVVHFNTVKKVLPKTFVLCLATLGLFVIKNLIICGVPVFPSKLFSSNYFDYSLPVEIEHFYYEELKKYGYFLTTENYDSFSKWDLFLRWLQLPKMNGLFNKLGIGLLLVAPFFFLKIKEKAYRILYVVIVIQLGLLFATSPQYRFFLNGILWLGFLGLSLLFVQRKSIYTLLTISSLPLVFLVFVPVNLNQFSNYKFMLELSHFKPEYTIIPHGNSKYTMAFEKVKEGNLEYYSPINNTFFWGTYGGPLPTVNKDQVNYFKTYFNLIPQQRTSDLKDGFYSKKNTHDTQRTP
jgi:hypothetical protein